MCVYVGVGLSAGVCLSFVAHRGWAGVAKALELILQAVMRLVLVTKLRSAARAVHIFVL